MGAQHDVLGRIGPGLEDQCRELGPRAGERRTWPQGLDLAVPSPGNDVRAGVPFGRGVEVPADRAPLAGTAFVVVVCVVSLILIVGHASPL
jgi:hypothetical protein